MESVTVAKCSHRTRQTLASPFLRLILINDSGHGSFFLENLEEVPWHVRP